MFAKFRERSHEEELLDDFKLGGKEIEDALVNIERVNTWLGGNAVLLDGFKQLLNTEVFKDHQSKPIVLRDIGCGGGDGLRTIVDWTRKQKMNIKAQGHDANQNVVLFARQHAKDYPEIEFKQHDILSADYNFKGVDILCCSLFLHHFTDEQITDLIKKCFDDGVKGVLINDLHRHWLAYYLFRLICKIFRAPEITIEDGSLSVLRGFKKTDIDRLIKNIRPNKSDIQWRWAFRYQVLLYA